MANTPGGLPYPLGTDKVVDGDDAIHALATWLDPTQNKLTFLYGASPGWAQGGGYLVRVGGMWVLQVDTSNLNAGGLAAGFVNVGTVPAGARPTPGGAYGVVGMYQNGGYSLLYAGVDTAGLLLVWLSAAVPPAAVAGIILRGQVSWPVKTAP
jgi:hypothetical protein